METHSQVASPQSNRATADTQPGHRMEEVAYQVVTVCAILLVLGSLWLF